MKKTLLALSLGLGLAVSGAAQAKTLVFCSEGSPEGFNPSLYSAGTTFDASSQTIFNRLVQFEPGSTKVVPGLAESWTASADGLEYTFNLRKGVKYHTLKISHPHVILMPMIFCLPLTACGKKTTLTMTFQEATTNTLVG